MIDHTEIVTDILKSVVSAILYDHAMLIIECLRFGIVKYLVFALQQDQIFSLHGSPLQGIEIIQIALPEKKGFFVTKTLLHTDIRLECPIGYGRGVEQNGSHTVFFGKVGSIVAAQGRAHKQIDAVLTDQNLQQADR
jgi:hypothetical protein